MAERIRKIINMQYVKMKRMAAVGSLVLLAVNLAFTIYPYVVFKLPGRVLGISRIYFAVPVIFILIVLLIWLAAHIYVRIFEMYRTETMADITYNPYSIYAIGPLQEMEFRYSRIPTMEGIYAMMSDGKEKEKLKSDMEKMKKWCDLGYIPREDYPEHLLRYYLTNKQARL